MNLDSIKAQLISVLKKYPIKEASVFGSFSRNEQTEASDIDILIQSSETLSLFEILRMEGELSELVSRKIDIVELGALKKSIKDKVLSEAIRIL